MKTMMLWAALMTSAAIPAAAQDLGATDRTALINAVDANVERISDTALQIWKYAEMGYLETQSSALLQTRLKTAGFTVKAGVAGEPTAFVASFRNGVGPVIGVLAEYDALPGLSQEAVPVRMFGPGDWWCGFDVKRAGSFCHALQMAS